MLFPMSLKKIFEGLPQRLIYLKECAKLRDECASITSQASWERNHT